MSGVSIVDGSSKFDLMQALLVRKPVRPGITFTLEDSKTEVFCMVDLVKSKNESGEDYYIEGWVGNHVQFKANYQTDRQTGTYTILDHE